MRTRRYLPACVLSCLVAASVSVLVNTPNARAATRSAPSVVRWAEPVGAAPNYIFPLPPRSLDTVANVTSFQHLLFRPLYWYGSLASPDLNISESLAVPPSLSKDARTVTIDLKRWTWSDGEQVTSIDVAFWLNLVHADKRWWGGYVPGSLVDLVRTVSTPSPSRIVLTLSSPVSSRWLTANLLATVTPLPLAWDVNGPNQRPGAAGCSSASFGSRDDLCNGVFNYLSRQAGFDPALPTSPNSMIPSYAGNPLWQIVDGPYHLASLDTAGLAVLSENSAYVGPRSDLVRQFVEVPFISSSAELAALRSGALDVGYVSLPQVEGVATSPTSRRKVTTGLAGFSASPVYPWAISDSAINFSTTSNGGVTAKILAQGYVREAMQRLVDQPYLITHVMKGYGLPTWGPTPSSPAARLTNGVPRSDPLPYDPARAISLLRSHGWSIHRGGVSRCTRPGSGADQCGTGIPSGAPLSLRLTFAADVPLLGTLMNAEQASWSQAGIAISMSSGSSWTLASNVIPAVAGQTSSWELASLGRPAFFNPGVYPTGELLFATGAPGNLGSFSNHAVDTEIASSQSTAGDLRPYAQVLTSARPVIFQPTTALEISEARTSLHGIQPLSPLLSLTPELWHA